MVETAYFLLYINLGILGALALKSLIQITEQQGVKDE